MYRQHYVDDLKSPSQVLVERRVREIFTRGLVYESKSIGRNLLLLRDFTLIELLITISIIALLVAMLLPALNKARAKAHLVNCAANMKTLGQVAALYQNDNRYFVSHVRSLSGGSNMGSWLDMLLPTVGMRPNNTVDGISAYTTGQANLPGWIKCPSDRELMDTSYQLSYVYNDFEGAGCGTGSFCRQIKVRFPSKHMMFIEGTREYDGITAAYRYLLTLNHGRSVSNVSYRHGTRVNMLFADGHTEAGNPALIDINTTLFKFRYPTMSSKTYQNLTQESFPYK